jgi:hypothetical protein
MRVSAVAAFTKIVLRAKAQRRQSGKFVFLALFLRVFARDSDSAGLSAPPKLDKATMRRGR